MSTAEQEKIIEELRSKTIKVNLGESKSVRKIDKRVVWAKAKKAGQTISDDSML